MMPSLGDDYENMRFKERTMPFCDDEKSERIKAPLPVGIPDTPEMRAKIAAAIGEIPEPTTLAAFKEGLMTARKVLLAMAPKSRETSLVITKLDEAEMWAERIPSPYWSKP